LRTLWLHGNKLDDLSGVIGELRRIYALRTLTLYGNPLSLYKNYRGSLVFHAPFIQRLDNIDVDGAERRKTGQLFNQSASVHDSIAFGARLQPTVASDCVKPSHCTLRRPITAPDRIIGDHFFTSHPPCSSLERAVQLRSTRRSITSYTCFDWSAVQRPLNHQSDSGHPASTQQLITVQFR